MRCYEEIMRCCKAFILCQEGFIRVQRGFRPIKTPSSDHRSVNSPVINC